MALNAKKAKGGNGGNGGSKQKPIDPGTYPARVVQILDLGVQAQQAFQGKDKPPVNEIMITYEFLDEFCVDENGNDMEDKPRWLSEVIPFHNLKADKAKSTQRYYALDPNEVFDGDFLKLVDTPCNVVVTNRVKGDKVYNNIGGVSSMRPKEAKNAAPLVNPPKTFVLDEPDMGVFLSLPEWVQDKIKSNLEYEGSELQKLLTGGTASKKPAPKVEEVEEVTEEEASNEGDDEGVW